MEGGERKELEGEFMEWIYSMRHMKHHRVSRNMIRKKATEIYPSVRDGRNPFVASNGWLCKFLHRNGLKDPDPLTEKLVLFIDYVGKAIRSKNMLDKDVIAMDETV